MSISVPFPDQDAKARRNVRVLVLAQAILGAQMPMIFTIGGLAGKSLAPSATLATLPISMIVLGSMLSAQPLSAIMSRFGRRVGFWVSTSGGAMGGLLGAFALMHSSFGLFLLGSLFTGSYMSGQGFYRFAAADGASESYRPRAISLVMAGGLFSALAGPQLIKVTVDAVAIPFLGTYAAVIAINVLGSALFLWLDSPKPVLPTDDAPRGRSRRELLRDPTIVVAMIIAMVSYALMNLVMTSTPLAVVGCGYAKGDAANIVSAHVIAMYLPSFFTGWLINRLGITRIVATGLAIMTGAGAVALTGVDLTQFFATLILLGLGWNFAFIGATTLLTSAYLAEEKGRIQGINDFVVFGGVTLASLSSGLLMNYPGRTAVEGWQAVNLAMVPFLILAGGALIWLAMRPRAD